MSSKNYIEGGGDMAGKVEISAVGSARTEDELDPVAASIRPERNVVNERALGDDPASWADLPDEAVIPARLVLEDGAFDNLVVRLNDPTPPTEALVRLMRG